MSDPVQELKDLIPEQPQNPLRPNQLTEYREELDRLEGLVKAPPWMGSHDRGAATKRYRELQKILQEQAPRPVHQQMKDKVNRAADEVMEQVIKPALLTRAEMRRNPAGAVDRFRRREGSAAIKDAIMTWKRAKRGLEPDNTEFDYTNVEKYRKEGTFADGVASYMADAQIPGHFAMSPQAKEQWPLGEPTADTPLKQAQKRDTYTLDEE